ncbi:MAG: cobalt ECF transporter T component CbiQ [Magnetococcales bacterium]|nr:cobalt ECF transporter T component CbiQ [Magnetococcales bacterium]MBF0321361.1 cobalt ECF transporter T component CbiQ [Magnetococcales bacterium]
MSGGDHSLLAIASLDRMARIDSPVHHLDPRAKGLVTALFLLCVVSFDKYAVSGLLPFFLFPVVLSVRAGIPVRWLLRRLLVLAPFPLLVGLCNPLLDTHLIFLGDDFALRGGWFSLASILLRFLLAVSALLVLMATTTVPELGRAAEQLGAPRLFIAQILLLYRSLFLLTDEAMRMLRAKNLRSCGREGHGWRVHGRLVGSLLLRTLQRGERMQRAMLCRGFHGTLPTLRTAHWRAGEWSFLLGWSLLFGACRFLAPVQQVGDWMMGSGI